MYGNTCYACILSSCLEFLRFIRNIEVRFSREDCIMVRTKRCSFVSASFGLWLVFGKTEYNMLRLQTYPLISLRDNESVACRVGYWEECSVSLS
ncbi:unnamed protein product [Citrullus colocynthis]|uniref:Uncharacterized protein n=1 Tax=Citrullus colocynthis TaxID=252529 RepID=A0ABP0XZD7_9ROSI